MEKEFSVLKELLSFRGRRNVTTWERLVDAYYAIRDTPQILNEALQKIQLSSHLIHQILPALTKIRINSN